MMTLQEASLQLAPYLRNDEEPTAKINLAQERILAFGKWKGLVQALELMVYSDGLVTLPRDYETALAFARGTSINGSTSVPNTMQPRDQWFSFYKGGGITPDTALRPIDLGDHYCTFRPVTTAVGLKFSLGFRGSDTKEFVLQLTQTGDTLLNGQKFYLTDTLYDGRQVYRNQAGSLNIWGTATDNAIYISATVGVATGMYWKTDTGPFSQMMFMPFKPQGTAVGGDVWAGMLVPTENISLNPLAGDDNLKTFSLWVRRSVDQGVLAAEESFTGTFGTFTNEFASGVLQEVTQFSKVRTLGVITLLAQFPENEGTWVPVGTYYERDMGEIRYRRYCVPGTVEGDTILALCKRRYRPALDPTDPITITSIYSLRLALEALAYEDAGDLDKAVKFWAICKKSLDDQLSEHTNASGRTLPIYVRATGGSGLRAIR